MSRQRRDPRTEQGRLGEARAETYLRSRGYQIVERNFRCKLGELDIVARDRDTLVFVEVRTRSSERFGSALETVGHAKQRQLARLASAYLALRRPRFDACRFDVVGITDDRVEHVVDAFRVGLEMG